MKKLNKDVLIETINKGMKKYEERIEQYRERLLNAYAENNQMESPNVDKYGRLHAPSDGYSYDENIYAKGEYLPEIDVDDENLFSNVQRNKNLKASRIKILKEQKELFNDFQMKSMDKVFVSFSENSWFDSNLNEEVTYVYLKGPLSGEISLEIEKLQNEYLNDIKEDHRKTLNSVLKEDGCEVSGVIVSAQTVEDEYNSTYYKIAFKNICSIKTEKGNILTGTLSKKLIDLIPEGEDGFDFLIGKKVSFIANISPYQNDELKGLFKSPKQIKVFNEDGQNLLEKPKRKLKPSM